MILVQANDALMNLPTHVPITDEIYLDYALVKDPEDTEYVKKSIRAVVTTAF